MNIAIGDRLILRKHRFARCLNVEVLEVQLNQPPKEGIYAVKVKPLNAGSFWVLPE